MNFLGCALFLLYITGCEKDTIRNSASDLPATVSFSKNIAPILNNNCISCHGASGSSAMTPPVLQGVNTYQDLMASVDTIKPEESDLYQMVIGKGDNQMPPSSLLPANDASMILKWIQQGAKNN